MSGMIQVFQAYDRALIQEVPADDEQALEAKLAAAGAAFSKRDAWLRPHQRRAILFRAAGLLEQRQQEFATLIAWKGGKPLTDALVETRAKAEGVP